MDEIERILALGGSFEEYESLTQGYREAVQKQDWKQAHDLLAARMELIVKLLTNAPHWPTA
jgi:hypothetical protein